MATGRVVGLGQGFDPLSGEGLGEPDAVAVGLAEVGVVQEPVDGGGGGGQGLGHELVESGGMQVRRDRDAAAFVGGVDEAVESFGGYITFEAEAATLFFQLVSSRYDRASLIVTGNKVFGRWGEVFGDDVVAAAMIDRLVHHAEVIALKGDSYRLKDRDLGRVPAATATEE